MNKIPNNLSKRYRLTGGPFLRRYALKTQMITVGILVNPTNLKEAGNIDG